jgi:hypothetical protein
VIRLVSWLALIARVFPAGERGRVAATWKRSGKVRELSRRLGRRGALSLNVNLIGKERCQDSCPADSPRVLARPSGRCDARRGEPTEPLSMEIGNLGLSRTSAIAPRPSHLIKPSHQAIASSHRIKPHSKSSRLLPFRPLP